MITFASTSNTIYLPEPAYTNTVEIEQRQLLGRSDGGTVYVYDKSSAPLYRQQLKFDTLSILDTVALKQFFETDAVGMLNTFTYTDMHGNSMTARFIEKTLSFSEFHNKFYTTTITLEVSAAEIIDKCYPLLILNMNEDDDVTGRHYAYRDSKLEFVSDYVKYGFIKALRYNSAYLTGNGTYAIAYIPSDFDISKYKRTLSVFVCPITGISGSEPLYLFYSYTDSTNYFYVRLLWTATNTFDIEMRHCIDSVITDETKSGVTILENLYYHIQIEFNVYNSNAELYLNGTSIHSFTLLAIPYDEDTTQFSLRVNGDHWRIDAYAIYDGILNGSTFTPPTTEPENE